jgi:CRP/FNR family transcriptional regulator, cyclic AMP receptor protein
MIPTESELYDRSVAPFREVLQGSTLFARLNDVEIDAVLKQARVARYWTGDQIVAKGDPGESMMAVLRGRVSISVPSLDGRQVVLSALRSGDVFGEIALLDGKERTADATALTDCEILIIPRRSLWSLLERRLDLCIDLMLVLCDRLRHTNEQVEDLAFLDLQSRMAKVLLRLAADSSGDQEQLAVSISQRALGELVGGSRESVNKRLNTWKELGIISIEKGTILIRNIAALVAYSR